MAIVGDAPPAAAQHVHRMACTAFVDPWRRIRFDRRHVVRGDVMTKAEIHAAAMALESEEAELRARNPRGELSRKEHIAKVHAWAALRRELIRLERRKLVA